MERSLASATQTAFKNTLRNLEDYPNCPVKKWADFTNTVCADCPTNCDKCIGSTRCVTCSLGYFLKFNADGTQASCISCDDTDNGGIERCSTCANAKTCLTCSGGFYLPTYVRADGIISCTPGVGYDECNMPAGFYYDIQSKSCKKCPGNVQMCNSPTDVVACKAGFYLKKQIGANPCAPCQSNCATCSSFEVCASCKSDFYKTFNNTCNKAPLCLAG